MNKIVRIIGTAGGWIAFAVACLFVCLEVTVDGPDSQCIPPPLNINIRRGAPVPVHTNELSVEDAQSRQYAKMFVEDGRVKMSVWTRKGFKVVDMTRLAERFGD